MGVDKVSDSVEKLKSFVMEEVYTLWADECGTLSEEGVDVQADTRSLLTKLQGVQMLVEALAADAGDLCDPSHLVTCVSMVKNADVPMPTSIVKRVLKKARERASERQGKYGVGCGGNS